jgi:hypothetical protein
MNGALSLIDNSAWDMLRTSINHDWLPKTYLNFLNAWAENIDEMIIENALIPYEVVAQFISFRDMKERLRMLISSTVEALSPRQLVDEYPLNNMAEDHKIWLKEVIHALYCDRTGIKKTVDELQTLFESICEQHSRLLGLLEGKDQYIECKSDAAPFTNFRNEVTKLSRMISNLPEEIQVI